jgi:hypothetical protein
VYSSILSKMAEETSVHGNDLEQEDAEFKGEIPPNFDPFRELELFILENSSAKRKASGYVVDDVSDDEASGLTSPGDGVGTNSSPNIPNQKRKKPLAKSSAVPTKFSFGIPTKAGVDAVFGKNKGNKQSICALDKLPVPSYLVGAKTPPSQSKAGQKAASTPASSPSKTMNQQRTVEVPPPALPSQPDGVEDYIEPPGALSPAMLSAGGSSSNTLNASSASGSSPAHTASKAVVGRLTRAGSARNQ